MYTTQVRYDLSRCDKLPEIYAWFDVNGALSESANLAYDAQIAILTIVNCSGEKPPTTVCNEQES
jgi:hypothetical protein